MTECSHAISGMATPTIKSTYTLDLDTVRALEDMARRLGVSKSEALRRAIRLAAGKERREGSTFSRHWIDCKSP
jgi:Ribbon-helix-helix protein, copG family